MATPRPKSGPKNGKSGKKRKAPRKRLSCGEAGGKTQSGAACTHLAGWGTPTPGKGPCSEHCADAAATLQANKKDFLEAFGSGMVSRTAAARKIGKDVATVWRWRQADAAFDDAVAKAQEDSDRVRVELVEDTVFARIVGNKASPAETIFFLKNRAPARWKDRQHHEHRGSVSLEQTIREVAEDDGHDDSSD